jgi:Cu+-exporting ATPase
LLAISRLADILGTLLVLPAYFPWIQFAHTSLIVLWAGGPPSGAAERRSSRNASTYSLWSRSAMRRVLPQRRRDGRACHVFGVLSYHGMVPIYYEAAGVVVTLVFPRQDSNCAPAFHQKPPFRSGGPKISSQTKRTIDSDSTI